MRRQLAAAFAFTVATVASQRTIIVDATNGAGANTTVVADGASVALSNASGYAHFGN